MRKLPETISEKVDVLAEAVAVLIKKTEELEFGSHVMKATLVDLAIRAGIEQDEFIAMLHVNYNLVKRMMADEPNHEEVVADAIKKARKAS
jgi:hypothetical protein